MILMGGGKYTSDRMNEITGNSYKEFRDLLDDSDGPTSWIEFWEEVK